MEINTKQRAYLRSLAAKYEPIYYVGKAGLTPDLTQGVDEALAKRELVKVGVQKNCPEDIKFIGEALSGRTKSVLVQIMGKKITLYRPAEKPKIELP